MKILHLLTSGGIGGIEVLCREIASNSSCENCFCFLFGEGEIYKQMKEKGNGVYSLSDGKKITYSKFNKLKKIAYACDIVVVHHDDPFLELYYLALMNVYPRKKYISMVHHCYDPIADNLGYGFVKKRLKYYITSKMFRKSNRIIFVSEAGRTSYIKPFRLNIHKSVVIYNGIGNCFLENGKNVDKGKKETIKLAYVGRLVELKGVGSLVDILPGIIKKYSIFIDIVGDGKCRNDLEKKVLEYGIRDKVEFHGFVNDVIPFLKEADIFVYPSKTEIFGISIVEAMAFKCICVANNVGGIPEIICNGRNGFLNEDNTTEGLRQAVIKAIETVLDDRMREEMMRSARLTAEEFTISRSISRLENEYQKLLEAAYH